MMEFGKTLRTAREAKGYTVLQLAELTHLAPSVVEELENEDFSHIAAPIYGRGFVKLYCEAVGLAAKPLIDQFMDILNGNHEPRIRERPVVTEPPASPAPAPEVPKVAPPSAPEVPDPLPVPQPEPNLFNQDEQPLPTPQPPQPTPAPQAPAEGSTPSFSRFAAPMREYSAPDRKCYPAIPMNPRIAALIGAAILIAIALIFGTRALYRATTSETAGAQEPAAVEAPVEAPVSETSPVAAPKAKSAPRTQQQIPSLYID